MLEKIAIKIMFIILLVSNTIFSQVTNDIPNYFPVSPNAASFAKVGLFPVDHSTGKINISIPIYTIKTKELTVPISISYNSAGIQLDELASWVGLGWNLNAGGAVVLNVKGIPDRGESIPDLTNLAFNAENYEILDSQFKAYPNYSGYSDTAYDEYIINAPGLSGTFHFVKGKPIFNDLQNTTVKFLDGHGIEIVKDDGTIYHFGTQFDSQIATENYKGTNGGHSSQPQYVTSWFLKTIIPPNSNSSNDNINFNYKNLDHTMDYRIIIGESLANSSANYLESIVPPQVISNKLFLESIKFKNGEVKFTSTRDRLDLADDYKLDKISVFRSNGSDEVLLEEYDFVYDYYNRSGGRHTSLYPYGYNLPQEEINSRNKSLKLLELKNNILNVKHTFEYENTQLPERGMTQKDFWGYINTNTGSLTPPTEIQRISDFYKQTTTTIIGNGDRSANEAKMKSGILQKITYPEGGYSVFEYETNKYTEYVATPIITTKNASVAAYGKGCINSNLPAFASKTFTPKNYILGSGEISINFTPATQELEGIANVTIDGQRYSRPFPFSAGGTMSMQKDLSGTHTLTANEYRSGDIGANGCPITSINATWQESSESILAPIVKLIGGLRIKSIKNYDGINTNPITVKQYQYENENVIIKEGNGTYVRGVFIEDRKSDVVPILSTSSIFDNNTGGSPAITYGKITEIDVNNIDGTKNGKTEFFYQNIPSERLFEVLADNLPTIFKSPFFSTLKFNITIPLHFLTNFAFYKNELWNQGSLLKTNIYKNGTTPNTYKKIKSIENTYTILKQSTLAYNVVFNNFPSQPIPGHYPMSFNLPYNQDIDFYSGQFYYAVGQTSQGKKVILNTTETDYDNNEKPTNQKITTYSYENPIHNQVTKTETTNSENNNLRTQLSYPQDLLSAGQIAEMQKLVAQNKIDKPIKTETFVDNAQTSETITKYEESIDTGNLLLPKEIHSSKGIVETFPFNNANRKIKFNLYDTDVVNGIKKGNGNVLQYSIENGTAVCIIWGYNKSQPIAKIENATYTEIPPSLITAAQTASNEGNETSLLSALNSIRNTPELANAMVTTYTYIPLVGVSSITDPKGDTTTYTYDSFNRLQFVKDREGNILTENTYHYKNQ